MDWDPIGKTGLVATAGHCFDTDTATDGCQGVAQCDVMFVFDYTDSISRDPESGEISIPAANVYDCASIPACDVRCSGCGVLASYDYALGAIAAELSTIEIEQACSWPNDGQ